MPVTLDFFVKNESVKEVP